MGKFDGILICTDLDGTLYRNDKTISSENKEAIEYFKGEGGSFTFITGRMPYYVRDAYRAVGPNVPFGCCNGGGIYDGEGERYVWKHAIDPEVIEMVEAVDRAFPGVGIQVCGFDRTYFAKENDVMARFRAATGLPNFVCHYREVAAPFSKIIFGTDSEEEMLAIEGLLRAHRLGAGFDFVRSERALFEILPKGIDQGTALSKLVSHLGLDIRRTVAVGDFNNDIGMFRTAAVGIAVANACAEAREAADFLTVSNEEHAIARVIDGVFRGEYGI